VKPDVAIWRPQEGRHNIAELVVHAAYWKYRACRLIAEEPPRAFDSYRLEFHRPERTVLGDRLEGVVHESHRERVG